MISSPVDLGVEVVDPEVESVGPTVGPDAESGKHADNRSRPSTVSDRKAPAVGDLLDFRGDHRAG